MQNQFSTDLHRKVFERSVNLEVQTFSHSLRWVPCLPPPLLILFSTLTPTFAPAPDQSLHPYFCSLPFVLPWWLPVLAACSTTCSPCLLLSSLPCFLTALDGMVPSCMQPLRWPPVLTDSLHSSQYLPAGHASPCGSYIL